MKLRYYQRRDLLRTSAAIGLFTPFLRYLGNQAVAATVKPRVVFVYVPTGTLQESHWPAGDVGEHRTFQLNKITKPFESLKDDLLLIRGIYMDSPSYSDLHHGKGFAMALTARRWAGDAHTAHAAGISIDEEIVQKRGKKRLYLAVQPREPAAHLVNISSRGPKQPNAFIQDPRTAFEQQFGRATGVVDTNGLLNDKTTLDDKKRLFAALHEDGKRLQALFAGNPTLTEELGLYLEQMSRLQQGYLSNPTLLEEGPAVGCGAPKLDPWGDLQDMNNYPKIGAAMTKIMHMSLACEKTDVGILQWVGCDNQRNHRVTWLQWNGKVLDDEGVGHHNITHGRGGGDPNAKLEVIYEWYNAQTAALATMLKNTPAGDGTNLLQHTMIVTVSDNGNTRRHQAVNCPITILGGKALGVRTGRYVNLPGQGLPHNGMHVAAANVMGHMIESFGDKGGELRSHILG